MFNSRKDYLVFSYPFIHPHTNRLYWSLERFLTNPDRMDELTYDVQKRRYYTSIVYFKTMYKFEGMWLGFISKSYHKKIWPSYDF